jgi:pimeloyl-ACP methyl ester carboxylesterase
MRPDAKSMGAATLPLKRFDERHGPHRAVLLHGLDGAHRYQTCGPVPFAVPGHRTVLLDLPGFGESPKLWMRNAVERQVAAVHASLATYALMAPKHLWQCAELR